ncbi:Uncharacterized protein Rs2_28806 [Raphanus sativus]|nr:Uncharacterized protein Rs2_28806 [Raphanus sativus]
MSPPGLADVRANSRRRPTDEFFVFSLLVSTELGSNREVHANFFVRIRSFLFSQCAGANNKHRDYGSDKHTCGYSKWVFNPRVLDQRCEDIVEKVASLSSRLRTDKGLQEISKLRSKLPITSFRDAILHLLLNPTRLLSSLVKLVAGKLLRRPSWEANSFRNMFQHHIWSAAIWKNEK